ncbi:MAG: class I mannose-6-phosphate isomerase [Planctomycetes bacterium]|nr:class I mannose-6-phosphate isomerase [Planctomycetota bacterium]
MSFSPSPLRFRPIFKEKVWGGRRLEAVLGKALPPGAAIGEAWEISDHGEDLSLVAAGAHSGRTLRQLIEKYPREVLGGPARPFPLLFKSLDASETLSVQVHPGDREAARLEPGSSGKTEAWAVLHAEPGAKIVHGLAPGLSREEFYRGVEAIKACELRPSREAPLSRFFQWRAVERGDVVFLPAGTVHTIGSGIVLVEVQQSSDLTYRIFDWGRPRPLHLEQARQIPLPAIGAPPVYPRWLPLETQAASRWNVVRSETFTIDALYLPPGDRLPDLKTVQAGKRSFAVLIGLEGEAKIGADQVSKGDFLLIPAALERLKLASGGAAFSGLWVLPAVI